MRKATNADVVFGLGSILAFTVVAVSVIGGLACALVAAVLVAAVQMFLKALEAPTLASAWFFGVVGALVAQVATRIAGKYGSIRALKMTSEMKKQG